MAKKLGPNQRRVLRSMADCNGTWFSGCGWFWGTYSHTNRVCESLARRGLVNKVGDTVDGYGRFELATP